jgi:hypothetical protein
VPAASGPGPGGLDAAALSSSSSSSPDLVAVSAFWSAGSPAEPGAREALGRAFAACRSNLEPLHAALFAVLRSLMKDGFARERTLRWLGAVAEAGVER